VTTRPHVTMVPMAKKLILGLVVLVVVVVAAGAVWYFVLDDDEPEKATVGCDPEPCAASTAETLDGTWDVVAADSTASLAITETIGGVADHTAQGELTGVAGTVTVTGDQVTDAEVTVDMTTLEFTDAPPGFDVANRANAMREQGLETDAFPEATFVLSAPIDLPADVEGGTTVQATATGDLTLHGVSKPVTFAIDVVASGDTFQITPSEFVPVVLADFGISVDAPGFVADISDEGSFDFELVLQQAA
jgi:polyisoprenoid-binding protein YceI